MIITKTVNGKELTFALSGSLDTITVPELEKELESSVAGMEKLVFDFGKLEYISSAGLRILLRYHKIFAEKGGMVVRNVNPDVMDIFEVTGFLAFLVIE